MTDVEGSRAAVRRRVCVPRQLNQAQDQDSEHEEEKENRALTRDCEEKLGCSSTARRPLT